jgi:phytoene/squalene synthetase
MYRRAHELYGHARQALPELAVSSGVGVFVADSLLNTMSAKLRVAHHQTLSGLAVTLQPSRQLSLV